MPNNVVSILLQITQKGSQYIGKAAKDLTSLDKVGGAAGNAVARLNVASEAYSKTLNRLNPATSSFTSTVGKLAAVFGATQIVKGIISTAASFERYETALTTITGSSTEAKKSMDWITEFTAKTPFELDQVTDAFVKLSSRGYDATQILGTLGDTASAMGKSLDEAVEAFTDAATGEFERLKEFGIRASTAGDQVTFSWMQNGREMSKTIEKTQQDISRALDEIWTQRFGGGMARFTSTFTGMFSNLKDQITLFYKQIADAGAFDALKKKIADILATMERLAKEGKLNEWAKQLSKTLVSLMEAAGKVAKVLGAIGMAISPYLPALLEYGAYLLAIKTALSLIVGLPTSIYAQVAALSAAFKAMTGLNVVSWLGGVTAAFTALGLVLATGFAVDRISRLISLMREMADVKKDAQAASRKYAAMAQEFESYKDYEIRGRKELMLAEDEELRHYYENLKKRLQYWNRYRASLETDKPAESTPMPEVGGVTGVFDTGELDKWRGEMDQANKQIDGITQAMGELGDVARTNAVDLDAQSGSLDAAGRSAEQAAQKIQLTEKEFGKLKETISKVGDEYSQEKTRLDEYYRFAADKAKALATDEDAAAKASIEIAHEKREALINAAYEIAQKQLEILNQSNADEQQRADVGKQIAEGLKKAKIGALKEWQSSLQAAYTDAIARERAYHDEVIRLQNDLKAARQSTEDKIRDLQRQTMSAEEAWNDKRQQAYETLARAQEELTRANTAEGLEKAKASAEQAQQQFQALAGEVKEGDQTVVSLGESIAAATEGVETAGQVIENIIKKQIEFAEQSKQDWADTAATIQQELDKVSAKIEQLNETTIHPTAKINVDSREVDAKLAELNNTETTSVHKIIQQVVPPQAQARFGGLIQKFASGGWARLSGKLAGWGGGDRIRALLEAGEFIIRKEAVAKYGAEFFNALNGMRLDIPKAVGAAAMPMMPPMPKSAYATGGPVAGIEDLGSLRLQAGDAELPVLVQGPNGREMVKEFERQLDKMRLTRGR